MPALWVLAPTRDLKKCPMIFPWGFTLIFWKASQIPVPHVLFSCLDLNTQLSESRINGHLAPARNLPMTDNLLCVVSLSMTLNDSAFSKDTENLRSLGSLSYHKAQPLPPVISSYALLQHTRILPNFSSKWQLFRYLRSLIISPPGCHFSRQNIAALLNGSLKCISQNSCHSVCSVS